jgi:hypothetical protein
VISILTNSNRKCRLNAYESDTAAHLSGRPRIVAGGAPVKVDEWGIDLGLLGSQKVLSCAPDLGVMTVSDRAWKVIGTFWSQQVLS